jgi:hypothetical protein
MGKAYNIGLACFAAIGYAHSPLNRSKHNILIHFSALSFSDMILV